MLLAGTLLAGCSSDDDTASGAMPASAPGGGMQEKEAPPAAPEGAKSTTDTLGVVVPGVQALVRTLTMSVRVEDVNAAVDAASRTASGAGGLVGGTEVKLADQPGDSTARLVLRVPEDSLDEVTRALRGLGTPLYSQGTTEDVTAQVADVDSRVETQRRSIARVRALLSEAKDLEDVVAIEGQLAKRESDLEALQAQQRALADRTAMATVTLELVGTSAASPVAEDRRGFAAGLRAGWDAFTSSGVALLTVVGALLPFAVALGLVALVAATVVPAVRRRRRPPAVEQPTA
jgi:hypothetical protein